VKTRSIIGVPPGHQPIAVVDQVQLSVALDPWLSLRALGSYCSMCRRTLQALINDPRDPIPSYRVGGRVLVRRSEFDVWMTRRRNTKARVLAQMAAADAQALLSARSHKIPQEFP